MGTYIVFEGHDYVGKTTLTINVANKLQKKGLATTPTSHPGATPLGQVLRKLAKNPEMFREFATGDIKVDPMSVQTLMMIDQICFINTILKAKLEADEIVLADRSNFISCIAYGLAEGLDSSTITRLLSLAKSPMPDRVFVLQVPWEIAKSRVYKKRAASLKAPTQDRFEDAGDSFMRRVAQIYNNLTTMHSEVLVLISDFVALDRIKYIDATIPEDQLADQVVSEIITIDASK